MSARKLAVNLLLQRENTDGYLNLMLDHALENSELDLRDKRFCSALCYGVLERQITLDHIIRKYSKKPPEKLDTAVLQILRVGLYQLLYMKQVPDTAAVSESVKLTKKFRKASASGFVNAVLRSFIRDNKEIDYPKDTVSKASVMYSVPEWLVKRLFSDLGEDSSYEFLKDSFNASPLTIRRNPLAITEEELITDLEIRGIEKHKLVPNAYILKNGGNIRNCKSFKNGGFHVQDIASQLCAAALGAKDGEIILDLCAAPGGKTFTIAENMNGTGMVYAFDLFEQRVGLIKKGAERLHLENVSAKHGDALVYNKELPKADRVLCDVPCSGIGVIRRKPEIRYKSEEEVSSLPELQWEILQNAAKYVKTGGVLIYSTCTILKEENEEIAEKFLLNYPDFKPEPLLPELHDELSGSMKTLLPSFLGSDGFFMAKFRRVK